MYTSNSNTLALKESYKKSQERLKEFSMQVKKRQIKSTISDALKNEVLLGAPIGLSFNSSISSLGKALLVENQHLLGSTISNFSPFANANAKDTVLKNEEQRKRIDTYLERVSAMSSNRICASDIAIGELLKQNQRIIDIKIV